MAEEERMMSLFKKAAVFLLTVALGAELLLVSAESGITLNASQKTDSVAVTLQTAALCCGLQGELSFDSTALKFDYAVIDEGLANFNAPSDSVKAENGKIKIIITGKHSGDWITLYLTPISTGAAKTEVLLKNVITVDEKGSGFSETDISLTVNYKITPGDVNGDGITDLLDLIRIKKYLSVYNDVKIIFPNTDCISDGKITAGDMAAIRKILLK